jgi:hypothetical protein
MRFRLRTLMIVMTLGGPLCAWGWKESQSYRQATEPVFVRQDELRMAKSRDNGSRLTMAAVRHAELRLKRQQTSARQESRVYWLLAPPVTY